MPDRIYTFQQRLVIQFIESLAFTLTDPGRSPKVVREQYRAVCRMVDRDSGVPKDLRPGVYFEGGSVLPDRVLVDELAVWLTELHEHYETIGKRRAAR